MLTALNAGRASSAESSGTHLRYGLSKPRSHVPAGKFGCTGRNQ
jgi:hypothetical protein